MKFANLLEDIFSLEQLKFDPPVLIDIGASGIIHKLWKEIAKYSICIAFDADKREMQIVENANNKFKKLFIYNCIVSDQDVNEVDFYLTKSPYCSSVLKPDTDKLKIWSYAEKFEVIRKTKIKVRQLTSIINELKIKKIDWYKSDSQGLDLRLFKSLPDVIKNNIITTEFEPGFIDSYLGEDKLSELIRYMETQNFWLSDIVVKGSQRVSQQQLGMMFSSNLLKKLAHFSHKTSVGWAELTYLNNFEKISNLREYLLGWVFSTILEQHGFALSLIDKALANQDESITKLLVSLQGYSKRQMKKNILKLKFMPYVVEKISKILKLN